MPAASTAAGGRTAEPGAPVAVYRVAVGSTNPAKIEAVRQAFAELRSGEAEVHSVAIDAADDQPWGEQRTRDGALLRARRALEAQPAADWGVGLEGGMTRDDTGILVTSWIAACHRDGRRGLARAAGFYLPGTIAAQVREGVELADAWTRAHGMEDVGRGGGTVGVLTGGRIDRARLYRDAVVLAVSLADDR